MNRTSCSALAFAMLAMFSGCSSPSPTTPPQVSQQPAATSDDSLDAKVAELFSKFQQLPENEKDTLKGDKLIIQIEGLLGGVTQPTRRMVEKTVAVHNAKLLKRALEDTSADPEPEVTGTEILDLPRERK